MSTQSSRPRGPEHHNFRHGRTRTKEWNAWRKMVERCHDTKAVNYGRYGGRGIQVCERWRVSFADFLADIGKAPSPQHSLERKNNDGNYEPGNVVWAGRKEQARNKRNNVVLEYGSRQLTISAWAEEHGMSRATLWARLRLGWSVERALTTPVRRCRRRPK